MLVLRVAPKALPQVLLSTVYLVSLYLIGGLTGDCEGSTASTAIEPELGGAAYKLNSPVGVGYTGNIDDHLILVLQLVSRAR